MKTETITRFKGLNQHRNAADTRPDEAMDLMNVICSSSGAIEKLRVPVAKSALPAGATANLHSFYDYQNALRLRQVIAVFLDRLYLLYGDDNLVLGTLDDYLQVPVAPGQAFSASPLNNAIYDFVTANNIGFGANGLRLIKWFSVAAGSAVLQNWGFPRPAAVPILGAKSAGAITISTGRRYRYAGRNSTTGHVGTSSATSASTGALAAQQQSLSCAALPDAQIDQIELYATLDGGADYFYHSTQVNNGVAFIDNTPDAGLDRTIRAPLLNDPPPAGGKFLALWNGRVFILFGQTMAYSGYEKILRGRPEESFPPSNRVLLAIGADEVAGMGAVPAGIVILSKSNEMFQLRGQIEDIVTNQPINFSAFFEQLPWNEGTRSHHTIVSTSAGMLWWSSDNTVKVYTGVMRPSDISEGAYPILRSATQGREASARAVYVDYVERNWYALAIATNGSAFLNTILLFDLEEDDTKNAGIFIFSVGNMESVGVIENSLGQRRLMIAQGGILKELTTASDTVNGITKNITATAAVLEAFWQGGYFGNKDPGTSKMNRWARLVVDQENFALEARLVDENFRNPRPVAKQRLDPDGRYAVNERSKRISYIIRFPKEDASANVQALTHAYVPGGTR